MQIRVTGILVVLVLLWSSAGQARGNVSLYPYLYKDITYTQTSSAQPTTPSSFSVRGLAISTPSDDLTSGSVTNGTSSQTFAMPVGPFGLDGSASYASLAAMNAAFPDGSTDTFSVSGTSEGTVSGTLTQPTGGLFTPNIPYLTNLNQLQGMDPSQAVSLDFNSTQTVAGASNSQIFFNLVGVGSIGYPDSFTSFPLTANALQPNTTYAFEIDYSNWIIGTAVGGFSETIVSYDVVTDGTFTTGS